jgi:hypothetical protein
MVPDSLSAEEPERQKSFIEKYLIYFNRIGSEDGYTGIMSKPRAAGTMIIISDSVNSLKYNSQEIFKYCIIKQIDLRNIDIITADSIVITGYDSEEWVDSATAKILSKEIVFVDSMVFNCSEYDSKITTVSFDTSWTKSRYKKLLNRAPFDSVCASESYDLISYKPFNPEIQKAFRDKKLFITQQTSP